MTPEETSKLLPEYGADDRNHLSFEGVQESPSWPPKKIGKVVALISVAVSACVIILGVSLLHLNQHQEEPVVTSNNSSSSVRYKGPYQLLERQEGLALLDYYDFHDGPDSLGSAGFNQYVSRKEASTLGLFSIEDDALIMKSAPNGTEKRPSIRLEGKRRFNRGLFILHVDHIPAGCGTWPAFWLTEEDGWPKHGEIDIVEGVNDQNAAKTALHTSKSCSMYDHVPPYTHSGDWDRATGIPNTWTGKSDLHTSVPADDCWVMAPHQWANQGCVVTASHNDTLGAPFNEQGGGVYALEWDPDNGYIKSWVFPLSHGYPDNLQAVLYHSASAIPDPSQWTLPYAYFAIGEGTGCSADHFSDNRLIFNLAFCGTVAGNRFARDCPALAEEYAVKGGVVATCDNYIASNPKALDEAYWKVRGVYVYQRAQK